MSVFLRTAGSILGAAMLAIGGTMPPLRGQTAPTFEYRAPAPRDGLGRRKPRKSPPVSAKPRTHAWRTYAAKVVSTHSDREDPRADKYLHSKARAARAARRAMAARG
jgi:hypothetical protein